MLHKLRWWLWNILRLWKLLTPDYWRVRKVARTCKPVTMKVNVMPRPLCIGYFEYPSLTALRDSEFANTQIFWVDVPERVLHRLDGKSSREVLETLKEMGYKSRPMQ